MSKNIQLILKTETGASEKYSLVTDSGQPLTIQAKKGATYELYEPAIKAAPVKVIVKREGDDLHINADADEGGEIDIIIEDYYDEDAALIGLAEDGNYYSYFADDASGIVEVLELSEGITDFAMLGVPGNDGLVWLIGALGIGALAGAAGGGGGSGQANVIDTTPPSAPPAILDPTSDSGVTGDGITNDDTPTISGDTATPGDTITVIMPGTGEELTTTVAPDGTWSVTPTTPIPDGTVGDATVTATDPAGNESPATTVPLTIDTTPPVVDVDDITLTNDSTPELTGTVDDPDATVVVTVDGVDYPAVNNGDGTWTLADDVVATLADGTTLVDVSATDIAGNIGTGDGTVTIGSDVGPVTDSDADANTVSENAAIGDAVEITGLATDPDGDAVTYSLTDDAGGLFAIDPTTGVVTVAGNLDYETATSHTIEITATSTDGSTSAATFTIDVTDADGTTPGDGDTDNPVGPVTDSDADANTVSENAAIGDAVEITGLATDPDGDAVTYSLTDDAGGLFAIDPTTGVVTVAGNLDYETATSHTIEITATSTDGSTSAATFTIDVTDADGTTPGDGDTDNPVGPVTDSDADANTVSENAAIGDAVEITGLATDPDGDAVTYSLTDDAGGLFAIDPTTGVVTVAGNLDYETATSHTIEITATSTDGSTSAATFTIDVTDADGTTPGDGDTDNPVGPVTDSDADANTVSENAAIGDAVEITGLATDPDGDAVTYSLTDDAGGLFAIDPTTGVVTVAGNLDYETATSHTIEITATSTDGSTSAATFTIDVTDDTAPVPTIELDANITADDIIDATEAGETIAITGTVGGEFNEGDTVTLTINSATYTGTVDAGGLFSIDVAGSDLAADSDTTIEASITTEDLAGNVGSATDTETYSVDTSLVAATITLDTEITADDIINATEAGETIAITGTVGGDIVAGDTVTVSVNGTDYTSTVNADGTTFSVDVPGAELAADPDTTIEASVTTTTGDVNGEATATDTETYSVDTTAPTITNTTPIEGDDIISASEAGTVTISGTTTGVEDGQTVTVTISDGTNSVTTTATVTAGAWTATDVDVSTLAEGTLTVTSDVTDIAGNPASDTDSVTLDISAPVPTITLDTEITADDIINIVESNSTIAITGTVGGDFNEGDTVTLTINSATYTGTVDAGGLFSIDVAGSDLAADADTTIDASVTTTDTAGNSATATDSETYSVDVTPPTPISIELSNPLITTFNPTSEVTITFSEPVVNFDSSDVYVENGYVGPLTSVDGGITWTGTLYPPTAYDVDISETMIAVNMGIPADYQDLAGNDDLGNKTLLYAIDNRPPDGEVWKVEILLDSNNDAYINAAEQGTATTTDVKVSFDTSVRDGDVITLTDGTTTWTQSVSTVDNINSYMIFTGIPLPADGSTLTVTASLTADDIGNPPETIVEISDSATIDTTAPTITNTTPIEGDDIINASEAGTVTISGTTTGVEDGQTVTVTISDGTNSVTTTATVTAGAWTATDVDVSTLAEGTLTVTSDVTDIAGNPASDTDSVTLDTTAPTITNTTPIEGDDIISASEAGTVTISGTTTGVEDGQTVTVTISDGTNSVTTTATVTAGAWTATDVDVSTLAEGTLTVTSDVTDIAGNPASDTDSVTLDTTAPTITNTTPIEGDDIISASEAGTVTISGTTTGVEDGQTVTVTISDGTNSVTTTATVTAGAWTATDVDVSTLAEGTLTVTSDVTDIAGNPASDTDSVTLDISAPVPTITLDTEITADDIINIVESNSTIAITGTVGGDFNEGDTVTLTINSATYTGTVDAGGLFSIDVAGSDLAADADTTIDASVTTTDTAGNSATATDSETYSVDTTAPTMVDQSFDYAEQQVAGAEVAAVVATDDVAVTGYTFAATGTATSADGFFQIDSSGHISITAAGVADAVNDFEVGATAHAYDITATDAVGNETTSTITLNETDANEAPVAVDDTTQTVTTFTPVTTSIFDTSFESSDVGLVDGPVDGWSTDEGNQIEVWGEEDGVLSSDGSQHIELNTVADPSTGYTNASNIFRTIDTIEGAEYNLNFDYSPRPDRIVLDTWGNPTGEIEQFDETINVFEILIDGVVVAEYSADGTGNTEMVWTNGEITFTGTGSPMTIEFRESSDNDQEQGRGMHLDAIDLTQTVMVPDGTQEVAISTDEDTLITVDVLSNDTDENGDSLSITHIQGQDVSAGQIVNITNGSGDVLGTAQVVDNEIVFNPNGTLQDLNTGDSQDVTFDYTIADGNGGSDSANVTINVTGTAEPVAVDDTGATDEDTSITINVLANDTDTDGDTLTITHIQGQAVTNNGPAVDITNGSGDVLGTAQVVDNEIVFNPNGTLQDMGYGDSQDVTFDYTISDGNGGSDSADVTINVTGMDEIADGDVLFVDDFQGAGDMEGWTQTSGTVSNDNGTRLRFEGDSSATKTFDFGVENAGREVTVTFDSIDVNSWDGLDDLIVQADGVTKINTSTVDTSHSFTATVQPDGTITLMIQADPSAYYEDVAIDNLVITANGTGWVQSPDLTAAQLVDGIVEGLYYETSSGLSGYTDADGNFDYLDGDIVTFMLGDIAIGSVDMENIEDGKVFLQDIADVERTDLNDEYVENMAVLLQSLDSDSGDNIVITQEMHDALSGKDFDLATIPEEELVKIIEDMGLEAVSENDAMEHVQDMLEEYTDLEESDFDVYIDDMDFHTLADQLETITLYDLGSEGGKIDGHNTLNLRLSDLLGETQSDAHEAIRVLGEATDKVNLIDEGSSWNIVGTQSADGVTYNVYHNSALDPSNKSGDVWVEQGITVL